MSNALRIDLDDGSQHKAMLISEDIYNKIELRMADDVDGGFDLSVSLSRDAIKEVADYLLAWLDKNGGQP